MDFRELELKVVDWSKDRKIIPNSTPVAQTEKAQEELDELKEALANNDHTGVFDALGDILVCLINVNALYSRSSWKKSHYGSSLVKCLELAYQEIKDRKGYLGEDGIFYKE